MASAGLTAPEQKARATGRAEVGASLTLIAWRVVPAKAMLGGR